LISNKKEKPKILIVDDEQDINTTLKILLSINGFEVDNYSDPEMALKDFKSNVYDLLILDLKMPKLDGFQLYEEIKKRDANAKVCFLTAGELYSNGSRGTNHDPSCFIRKPVENDELIRRINEMIIC
jgi:two-component system, OmpR family, response regulator ChvI